MSSPPSQSANRVFHVGGTASRVSEQTLAVAVERALGDGDEILSDGAHAYLRDLPNGELHLLDTGHFALEDKVDDIASLMLDFLDRELSRR